MSSLGGGREVSGGSTGDDKFRVPIPVPLSHVDTSPPNWLHQQTFIDGSAGGRHFSSWERTTHYRNQGNSSLITTVEQTTLNGSKPVIKPIPSRLGSPLTMIKYEPRMFQDLSTNSNNSSIKSESGLSSKFDEDGGDSAFEDDSGCSRTTPVNHKSIRKWRQHSQPGGGNGRGRNSSSFQPISIHTSSPFEDPISGPLSAPSTLHHWTNNRPGSSSGGSAGSNSNGSFAFSPRDSLYASPTGLSFRDSFETSSLSRSAPKCETITSPEHLNVSDEGVAGDQAPSIPVGIAVARQRSEKQRESSPFTKNEMDMMMPQAPTKLSDLYARPPPAHHHPHSLSPWQSMPFSADAFAQHQSALATLPLGYQLAKDPLTGQVFFVPGAAFAAAAAFTHHTQLMWPPPGASMPPPPPPPPLSPSPFHQSLLQLQQETWLARHQYFYNSSHSPLAQLAAAASVPTPPPAHQRSSEPITTLRVPSSASVASLISSENEIVRRPPRIFKEETPERDLKHRNFLVDNLCRASSSLDSNVGVCSEASDDRISVGSFSDEIKYTPVQQQQQNDRAEVVVDQPNHIQHRIENVKTERKDSCDSVAAIEETKEDHHQQQVHDQTQQTDEQMEEEDDDEEEEIIKTEPVRSGLDLLAEGIERLEKMTTSNGCCVKRPRLSSTPPRGARHMSVDGPRCVGGLRLLCDVALMSGVEEEDRKSPKGRSRSLDSEMRSKNCRSKCEMLARNYSSPKAEQNAKAFIASKSVRVADVIPMEVENDSPTSPSTWKMGAWEKNVRLNIANIQREYKEKYKELYRLQHLSTKKQRDHGKLRRSSSEISPQKKVNIKTEHPAVIAEECGKDQDSLWRKKSKNGECDVTTVNNESVTNVTSTPVRWEIKNKQDLSDITSKFKSSRPNPFENLLRLSAHKSSPKPSEPLFSSTPKISKPSSVTPTTTLVGNVTSVVACSTSPTSSGMVDLTNSTEKSRHSSPPRKTYGSHHHSRRVMEAIVIKKPKEEIVVKSDVATVNRPLENGVNKPVAKCDIPKLVEFDNVEIARSSPESESITLSPPVLEPMTEAMTKAPLTFKISKKESTSTMEDEEFLTKSKKSKKYKKNKKEKRERKEEKRAKKEKKMKVVVDDEESCDAITDKDPECQQVHKKKKSKKSRPVLGQGPDSCVIQESDLTEGLRVLIKLEGHFYPGKIQAISPPDIYGVLVDRERGNKPHIFSREEVLKDAIFEVLVPSAEQLVPGTRVCAYWSQKYHHLYPGTVSDSVTSDPKLDSNYVNIELDDGDSRDIHFENVRFLPPDYPLVEYDPDPMASLTKRKRRHSFESTTSEGSRATKTPRSSIDEKSSFVPRSPIVDKSTSCIVRFPAPTESQRSLWAVNSAASNQPRHVLESSPAKKQLKLRVNLTQGRKEKSKEKEEKNRGMAAFLHPQQLWRWSSDGVRRPRSRRIVHQEIEREEDESLTVGDCAVFLSTGRPDRPYVGRIEALWESAGGHMRVKVRWFYHAVETEGCANGGRRVDELTLPGALFESNHFDENDVQTISHRCEVVSLKAYKRIVDSDPKRIEAIYENNDLYYLAGEYDPIVGTIRFEKGVLDD